MKAAVDIGTNSIRLLTSDDDGVEVNRIQRVTGLGRGVDRTGRLADDGIERTVAVLAEYGRLCREQEVSEIRAVATSATRDAENREEFLDRAEAALSVRPRTISGAEEAALSFAGATAEAPGGGPYLVVDIGGGSTEFVWRERVEVRAVSIDIGSVRLTDRLLVDRPATFEQLESGVMHVGALFEDVHPPPVETVIGVAGTWTSLAAMHLELPAYDRAAVHHAALGRLDVDRLVERLARLTTEETAGIPSLDPGRAPVILGGAVVAREVMRKLGVGEVVVSEHDLLDGLILQAPNADR